MNVTPSLALDDERFHDLLAEYLRRVDAGEDVSQAALISAHPEYAAALAAYFEGAADVEEMAGPAAGEAARKADFDAKATVNRLVAETSVDRLPAQAGQPVGNALRGVPEAASSRQETPKRFGRYQILKALGQGAMGAVYLARDTQLDRKVALKIPKFSSEDSADMLARFYREARAAAMLRHPNICPVFDVGEIDGQHYITMAFIEGRPLKDFARAKKLPPERNVASVIRKLALGLAEAHAHGVIHRDLKPANIMVDGKGEPVVMDFGLARRDEGDDRHVTRSGAILGTPAYMSPEQVAGDQANIGPPADVYSLGVVMYELLTGKVPFSGPLMSILMQIASEQPKLPCELRPGLDVRLEAICLKMMAKRVGERYGSMNEVAAALGEYLKAPASSASVGNALRGVPGDLAEASVGNALRGVPSDSIDGSAANRLQDAAPNISQPTEESHTIVRSHPPALPAKRSADETPSIVARPTPRRAVELSNEPPAVVTAPLPAQVKISTTNPGRARRPILRKIPPAALVAVGGALGGIVLLFAAIILYVRLGKTDLKVTIHDESLAVKFAKDTVTFDNQGTPIRLRPGEQKFIVEQNGLEVETDSFIVKKEGKNVLEVAIVDGRVEVTRNGHKSLDKRDPDPVPSPSPATTPDLKPADSGFVRLFNNADFTGWDFHNSRTIDWKNDNGVITGKNRSKQVNTGGALFTKREYKDFHFRCEVRSEPPVPEMLYFRDSRSNAKGARRGYMLYNPKADKPLASEGWGIGALYADDFQKQPPECRLAPSSNKDHGIKSGDWYRLEFIARGEDAEVWINGKKTASYSSKQPALNKAGAIGLSCRAGGAVAYRNLEIKELTAEGPFSAAGAPAWDGWPKDAPLPAVAPFDANKAKEYQAAWARHLGVPVEWENSIGMKFRLIPPGEFEMGSTAEEIETTIRQAAADGNWQQRIPGEGPRHKVILSRPFFMGIHEVTQAQYQDIMGRNPSIFSKTGIVKERVEGINTDSFPVESVTWADAAEFCARLNDKEKLRRVESDADKTQASYKNGGYRVPTEAEWEFSCRAGTPTRFWGGEDDKDAERVGWLSSNSSARTHPVGELSSNPFGLFDVHGNVWEWVLDFWQPKYYEQFEAQAAVDPCCLQATDSLRVIRGGSWWQPALYARASTRKVVWPTARDRIGFRAVLSVDGMKAASGTNRDAPAQVVDLLKQVDVNRDAVKGKWTLTPAGLASDGTVPFCRLKFPYKPPAEYDYRVEFTAQGGNDILQLLTANGKDFTWLMGAWGGKHDGFDQVKGHPLARDGQGIIGGPTSIRRGQRHTSVIEVRKNSITAKIDGKLIVRHATDGSDLGIPGDWSIVAGAIGLGTTFDAVVFHKAEISTPAEENKTTASPGSPKDAPPPAIAPFDAAKAKEHQAAWAAYLKISPEYKNSVGMKFAVIPPGEFTMGRQPDEDSKFPPNGLYKEPAATQHHVTLTRPYLLGTTEVTQRQWREVMGTEPWKGQKTGAVGDDYPATYNTKAGAIDFCRRLSQKEGVTYRLPTEAEWEFACRAGSETICFFGDDNKRLVEYACAKGMMPVATKQPNPWNLFDMYGNLWEWVADGPAAHPSLPVVDPLVNPSDQMSILRGSCFRSAIPREFSSGARHAWPGSLATDEKGFRVVISADSIK